MPVKKSRDYSGSQNPHYNMPHSASAKAAITSKQLANWAFYREAVEKHTVNDTRIREIVREEIQKLLNESKPVNNKPSNIPL